MLGWFIYTREKSKSGVEAVASRTASERGPLPMGSVLFSSHLAKSACGSAELGLASHSGNQMAKRSRSDSDVTDNDEVVPGVPRPGNTSTGREEGKKEKKKQVSPAKHWHFTWNNYPENWKDLVVPEFQRFGLSYVVGVEVAPTTGTPHLQGFISSKKKIRPFSINLKVSDWSKMRSTVEQSIEYCCKGGNYIIHGYPEPPKPPPALDTVELQEGWQTEIFEKLKGPVEQRKIYWVWSREGGLGKSTFARYVVMNIEHTLVVEGKSSDMKFMIADYMENNNGWWPQVVILDVPRQSQDFLSYTGMEGVKNGLFASTKYKGRMVITNQPHMIVLANFPPNLDNDVMSKDRFIIWDLDPPPTVEELHPPWQPMYIPRADDEE